MRFPPMCAKIIAVYPSDAIVRVNGKAVSVGTYVQRDDTIEILLARAATVGIENKLGVELSLWEP